MARVVSLGSVNVDRLHRVSGDEVDGLAERYDWFPGAGETVSVDDVPARFGADEEAPEDEEVPADFVAADEVRHGGKGANQAVAAAHAGVESAIYGKIGVDHEEYGVIDALENHGVDIRGLTVADTLTGTADIFLTPDGENRIVVHAGANGTLDHREVDVVYELVRAADVLLLQNEIPPYPVSHLLDRLSHDTRVETPTVVLDPAPPAGCERYLSSDALDYVTPNEHEYRTLREALASFNGIVVRKRGGDDVIVENDHEFRVTPPSVEAVDTTGAGDVFNGYLGAELARETDLREAVELATVAAAMAIRESGARNGIPDRDAVLAFRESG